VPQAPLVTAARRGGRPVHVWTVDDPARAAVLWARGVSGITTNRPGRLRAARDGDSSNPGNR
jgi:glycerophosphoryl diester phosphodiesterase